MDIPDLPEEITIGHVTIKELPNIRINVSCSICDQGIDIGPSFGGIPGDVLMAEWIKQHAHRPKARKQ